MKRRLQKAWAPLACLGLTGLLVLGVFQLVLRQAHAAPENPLTQMEENRSHMMLASQESLEVSQDAMLESGTHINKAKQAGNTGDAKGEAEPGGIGIFWRAKQGPVKEPEESQPEAEGPEKADAAVAQPEQDEVFFTTSIRDGETVTSTDYAFSISHKRVDLKVDDVGVFVEGVRQPAFGGRVLLEEGRNTIRVTAAYSDNFGGSFAAEKSYTVICRPKELAIDTDLKDQTVMAQEFTFRAKATQDGKAVPVEATLNGAAVTGANDSFTVQLAVGDNHIRLAAQSEGKSAEVSAKVRYEVPDVYIDTDLKDDMVSETREFRFTAALKGGSSEAVLDVKFDNKSIEGKNGEYVVSLNKETSKNKIRLNVSDPHSKKVPAAVEVRVKFEPKPRPPDPTYPGPKVETNLPNGAINDDVFGLVVKARDHKGKALIYTHLKVELNGTNVPYSTQGSGVVNYRLDLPQGDHALRITAIDDEGYGVYYDYVLTSKNRVVPKRITISVEAGALGLGNLVKPTEMLLYKGHPFSKDLEDFLSTKGFKCENEPMEGAYYLARIHKSNMTAGWKIPEDLLALMVKDMNEKDKAGFMKKINIRPDSLGAKDVPGLSGWLYYLNGVGFDVGMDGMLFNDGDVVRMRYSWDNGKDHGGMYGDW